MAQSYHQYNTIKLYTWGAMRLVYLQATVYKFIQWLHCHNTIKLLLQKIPTFKELHEICDNFPVACRCQLKMAVVTKQPALRTKNWNFLFCGQHNLIRQIFEEPYSQEDRTSVTWCDDCTLSTRMHSKLLYLDVITGHPFIIKSRQDYLTCYFPNFQSAM